ncbi:acyltransferase [Paenibacillus barcinonensis]|uniref:Acyltransferase n=1 Tax=Paenibacillus barcinonensis TaxID=198119 RepID=A0A2V4WB24_PAEBA|nr:acyltransferase [Paenibacillus barcinonensis]PYE48558.1 surface polysaccharide O-acyltransferase-like enzyme [Paenibacillus barcinonensis]QKS58743.1 acyltransferase [Paenibacillus barcinonensis]
MKQPKIAEWTELRGLAFLAIVMQHNIAEYIYRADIAQPDAVMLTMIYHLTRFGTPTFVFLSGVLLFYHHRHAKPNYVRFIRKRFGDIYMPFIIWTLIYWLAVRVFTPAFWSSGMPDLGSFIRELFLPQTAYHLWFVLMVFQFYILFPLFLTGAHAVRKRLESNRSDHLSPKQITLAIIFSAAIVYILLMKWSYYDMSGWTDLLSEPWSSLLEYRSYSWIMYWFYFLLGAVCAWAVEGWRSWTAKALPWTITVFIVMYIWLGYDVLRGSEDTMNLNISTYLKPSTFIIIMAQMLMFYGLLALSRDRDLRFRRLLAWIGRYSFGGYLVHALVIYVIAYFTRPLHLSGWHLPITILSFAVTVVTALGISRGLSKLPGSRFTVGLSRIRNKSKESHTLSGTQTHIKRQASHSG